MRIPLASGPYLLAFCKKLISRRFRMKYMKANKSATYAISANVEHLSAEYATREK